MSLDIALSGRYGLPQSAIFFAQEGRSFENNRQDA